ncbi:MAG: hypothetical protein WDW38_008125 [Sanguina aurantia]
MRSSSSGIKVHRHNHDQTSFLGLFLFAVSTLFLTLMSATAKLLAKRGMPVFEIVLGRSFFMTLCCIPAFLYQRVDPRGHRQALLTLRGCFGFASVSSIYWAVSLLPLSIQTLLSFLAPLFVALSAPVVLGEAPSPLALVAVPVCFLGVYLVAQPGAEISASTLPILGIMIGCLQAVFSAGAKLTVRALRTSNSSLVIVFWMSGLSSVLAGLACKLLPNHFMVPRDREDWLLLLATGVSGLLHQVSMTAGLMRAQAVPAMVLSYLSIVWGIALGVVMFNEHPNLSSIAGSTLICSCTLILSVHEVRKPAMQPAIGLEASDLETAEPLLVENDGSDVVGAGKPVGRIAGSGGGREKVAAGAPGLSYSWQAEH